ncbi:MAG: Plug domain-containing protein, partial [Muribaculaceae bacterium]|nr:Plug domain-containing protein [Muribaculaceae bacterium]
MMKFRVLILGVLISIGLTASPGERLQEDSLYITLKEINITAVKEAGKINDEPEASTFLTGKEIEQLGIVSMRGVSDVVPNFFIPDYGSRITSTIYVRGIGARMDHPAVGLNVDNVPYLNKDAYDFDISDIASVVMLRGPQST